MTQFITTHTVDEMVKSIAAYLPGGEMFIAALISGTNQNDLLRGIGTSLLEPENFIQVYNSEFIPDNTNVFIEEWESALGIPDTCFPGPAESDLSIRRNHILVKLASLGVQTVDDFLALAVTMGFPDTEVIPGVDFGVTPISEARFTIVVRFPAPADNIFPLDFPIPFGTDQYGIMACLFRKLKPANCQINFLLNSGPLPLMELPLISDTAILRGTGSSTFTRASTGSFVDKNDGRVKFSTNNTARFENNRYLTEGAFTNVLLRSQEFDNASWTKGANVTITADDTGSPSGTLTADKYANSGATREMEQTFTITDPENRTYTFGLYPLFDGTLVDFELILRRGDGSDGNTEVHTSSTGTKIGLDGWRRAAVTQTFSASTTGNDVVSVFAPEAADTGDIHLWGAQLQESPFLASYQITVGSTATKAADALSVPSASNIPLPGDPHSFSFTIDLLGLDDDQTIYNVTGETTRKAIINSAGNLAVSNGDTHTYTLSTLVNTSSKIAITFDGTTESVYQDGALVSSNVKTIATGTATTIFIGSTDGSTDPMFGHLQRFKTFNETITLEDIQNLS